MIKEILLAAMAFQGGDIKYPEALRMATAESRNLIVLVGGKGCAPCDLMKKDLKDQLKKGRLGDSVIVYLNKDDNPELASEIMEGPKTPQVAIFRKVGGVLRKTTTMIERFSPDRILERVGR